MPDTPPDTQADTPPGTRAERRARTHAAILAAARRTFADKGYQKSTIRAVAERAGCDPALVMQHFGDKESLFRAATALDVDIKRASAGPAATRPERLLRHTFERLDAHPDSIASTLRSMLTHDRSAAEALQLFNPITVADMTAAGEGDAKALLGHDLTVALVLGTAISRYVLKAASVETASVDDLVAALLPATEALRTSGLNSQT